MLLKHGNGTKMAKFSICVPRFIVFFVLFFQIIFLRIYSKKSSGNFSRKQAEKIRRSSI